MGLPQTLPGLDPPIKVVHLIHPRMGCPIPRRFEVLTLLLQKLSFKAGRDPSNLDHFGTTSGEPCPNSTLSLQAFQ